MATLLHSTSIDCGTEESIHSRHHAKGLCADDMIQWRGKHGGRRGMEEGGRLGRTEMVGAKVRGRG